MPVTKQAELSRIEIADPAREHAAQREAIEATMARVLRGGHYILGDEVERFEARFAAFLGIGHVVGVSSGSDALVAALHALGVGSGDCVLVPNLSFVATVEAIVRVGARPRFCDVTLDEGLLDPASVQRRFDGDVRAIVAVDLYGRRPDFDRLAVHGVPVVEDAAQSVGATRAMTGGLLAATSFFPSKPFGCAGDGGAVATNDASLADTLRALRQHGRTAPDRFDHVAGNFRLDAIQAAILGCKLDRLPERSARRTAIASALLGALDLPDAHAPLPFVALRVVDRDAAHALLRARSIASRSYYPYTLSSQPPYAGFDAHVSTPNADRWAREVVSLPCHPELDDGEVERLIDAARALRPLRAGDGRSAR